jgi:DNA-binding MarR family transcriptional regulator
MNEQAKAVPTAEPSFDGASILELSAFLPYRLNMLAHLVSQGIAAIYEDRFGLTAAQWRVMAAVAEYPGITAQKVVELTPMDKVTVSRAVAVLTEKELMERRGSQTDGRVALLSLTREGQGIYRQIAPEAVAYSNRLQQCLTESEREAYLELTKNLISAARTMTNDS